MAELARHLAEAQATAQACCAQNVGSKILVAQFEPVGATQALKTLQKMPAFALDTPTLLLVTDTGQGVHDSIKVGADPQAEVREIVSRIGAD